MASSSNAAFAVGLTGGIGSGKTTVANLFAERGAGVIDTDAIAHALTAPGGRAIEPITRRFGPGYITPEGAMNRAKMREHVFALPQAKKHLEAILHPLIRQVCEEQAAAADAPYVLFVVPLLIESGGWRQRVQRILAVDCPEQVQITRVMARSSLTEQAVRAIMATQASRQARLDAADDVVTNANGLDALVPQVEQLHALYLALAQAHAKAHPKP